MKIARRVPPILSTLLTIMLLGLGAAVKAQEGKYDPFQFGVPDKIGGHPVIAVLAHNNTMCVPDWEKRVVVQATST